MKKGCLGTAFFYKTTPQKPPLMSRTFINGLSCISAQPSFSGEFPNSFCENAKENILYAMEPPYKDYIPPAAIRRMSKSVKMSMVAASEALKQAQLPLPQAILVGTGMGCLQDSEKFLKTLLDNQEQHLTPTAFIQSTHNTVAGQIAINLQCKGMNLTYVNGACSFESALLEAKMHMEQDQLQHILVGGIDEHSPHTTYLYELAGIIKDKATLPCPILQPNTSGIRLGEGATFFALSDTCSEQTVAELLNVEIRYSLAPNEIEAFVSHFLTQSGCALTDIDLVISGRSENQEDRPFFDSFDNLFPSTPILIYKHLSGEFFTASAIGMYLACKYNTLKGLPSILQSYPERQLPRPIQYILLYNQYLGKEHSLVLLRKK